MNMRMLSHLLLAWLVIATPARAENDPRFPGTDADVRKGTPNDPRFDCYESDDEDDIPRCRDLGAEQYQLFGFAPDATGNSAYYKEGPRIGKPMISGVSADAAWKLSTGSPEVVIAIMDTGIRWNNRGLRRKVWLNRGELPVPQGAARHDADGDGAFTVDDYIGDTRVADANGNGMLDGQDLIRAFSNGDDADGNGYVDDIAGWDFLDLDNDPADVSSYSSARGHGTGRGEEAAEETNEGDGSAGICPQCRLMFIRPWDTFVYPGDNWAAGTVYAADNGALVQVVANGVLQNTRAAKAANRYAYGKDMALMHVSSDLNTANHNYPTNYVESVFINGCVPDLPAAGGNEFFGDVPGNSQLNGFLSQMGINVRADAPIQTWFRQANLTQHGAHAHVCFVGDTGSQATGQAGGGAGLIHSLGLQKFGGANRLSSNEVKQVLTLSAEDVLPLNTIGVGIPDRAAEGWDEHFGYGRADLGAALRMVQEGRIPPEAQIEFPAWWAMLDPVANGQVDIHGLAAARRSERCSYALAWALGVEPDEDAFQHFVQDQPCQKAAGKRGVGSQGKGKGKGRERGKGKGLGAADDGLPVLGSLPVSRIAEQLPGSRQGKPPEHVNEFVVTVRLRVTDAAGNFGEDRKTYFVYHDPTWHEGWPKFVDTGGETSPVLHDLDGDGTLEIIEGNSSGELWVWRHDGTLLPSFNGGEPWQLPPTHFYYPGSAAFRSGAVPPLTGGFRTPAVADLDGDGLPEVVAPAADGRIFVLDAEGREKFRVSLDASRSHPKLRNDRFHPKRGILGTVVLADLDQGTDGKQVREIIVGALDGHIYVWSGADGTPRAPFPVLLVDDADAVDSWGEIIATPAVGQLDDDPQLEIVSGTNEYYAAADTPTPDPDGFTNLLEQARGLVINLAAQEVGGSSRIHAINDDGTPVNESWPVKINGLMPAILPLVGPNHAVALADFDGDGIDSVVATITTSDLYVIEADGSRKAYFSEGTVNGLASADPTGSGPTKILNLFEYPAIGDINGFGGLDITKGGITAAGAVNLVATGQNLPFSHVVQVWDSLMPESYVPGYPAATDDYQLLSTPAIADVDGSGTREVIVGTGLYLLHAYNLYGEDAPGFPKLAGGWLYNVPAIGDIDGDGKLEIVAGTREGWRFVWDLEGSDGPVANGQWWTEGHDNCHTNNYGSDCRPPAAVANAVRTAQGVQFGATGDDWRAGNDVRYEIRPARGGAPLQAACLPAREGRIACGLPSGTGDVVVQAIDDAGNRSWPVLVPAR